MGTVLTQASNVTCGHSPGKVAVSSSAKLKVSGNPVLLKSSIAGQSIAGCSTPTVSGPPPSKPCTTVASVTAGEATKLTMGGMPVMLAETTAGTTDGTVSGTTPQTLLAATAGQTKLTSQ